MYRNVGGALRWLSGVLDVGHRATDFGHRRSDLFFGGKSALATTEAGFRDDAAALAIIDQCAEIDARPAIAINAIKPQSVVLLV